MSYSPTSAIGQREVVRRDFAGHVRLAAFAAADSLQRVGRREMGHVQACASELLGQLHIALHDRGLGGRLHAAQAQAKRGWAVIHGAAFSHARIFRMLNHRQRLISDDKRSVSRMTVSLRMGLPSSVTPTAPARCRPRKSVSTAPLLA